MAVSEDAAAIAAAQLAAALADLPEVRNNVVPEMALIAIYKRIFERIKNG